MATNVQGRFLWYELLTTAPRAAQDFYTGVVGWGTDVWEGAGAPYTLWTVGETPVGGIMNLPEDAMKQGARPHWLAHIGSSDVDRSVRKAAQLGATVMREPFDIGTVGRVAILTDPQGAIFSIYAPASELPDPEGWPRLGDVSWNELAVSNWEEAFDFYHDLFGWEKGEAHDIGEFGIYQIYKRNGIRLGGMFNKPPEMPAMWIFYARVGDVKRGVENIQKGGGTILNGPMEVPGGDWIVQFMDPQGALFALHALNPARL